MRELQENALSYKLIGAVQKGATEDARRLLAEGADANSCDMDPSPGDSPWPALMIASMNEDVEMMRLLLENGADANTGIDESVPLVASTARGHLEGVKLLLENGADIDARDDDGSTAADLAAGYGFSETLELLLTKGAAVDNQNLYGRTALMTAAAGHQDEEKVAACLRVLLKHGARLDLKNEEGMTAVEIAESAGNKAFARVMQEITANKMHDTASKRQEILKTQSRHLKPRTSPF